MNLIDEVAKIKQEGYSEANAQAKLCQDIIIKAISQSSLNRNVTIKGGVVIQKYIFDDPTISVFDYPEMQKRAERILKNNTYKKQIEHSRKNWLDLSVDEVMEKNLAFINSI